MGLSEYLCVAEPSTPSVLSRQSRVLGTPDVRPARDDGPRGCVRGRRLQSAARGHVAEPRRLRRLPPGTTDEARSRGKPRLAPTRCDEPNSPD